MSRQQTHTANDMAFYQIKELEQLYWVDHEVRKLRMKKYNESVPVDAEDNIFRNRNNKAFLEAWRKFFDKMEDARVALNTWRAVSNDGDYYHKNVVEWYRMFLRLHGEACIEAAEAAKEWAILKRENPGVWHGSELQQIGWLFDDVYKKTVGA